MPASGANATEPLRATSTLPRRRRLAAIAVVTLALGITSRLLPFGVAAWDKYADDAAYAAMVFVVLAVLRGARGLAGTAGLALVLCAAIEAFQATGLPMAWGRACRPLRLLLGTTFGWWDLLAYAAGVGGAVMAMRARVPAPSDPG